MLSGQWEGGPGRSAVGPALVVTVVTIRLGSFCYILALSLGLLALWPPSLTLALLKTL